MRVEQYMSPDVETGAPDDGAKITFEFMQDRGIRHLPVIDPKDGAIVGIVTDRDLRRPPWVDAWTEESGPYQLSDDLKLEDVMTRLVFGARLEAPIGDVAEMFIQRKIGAAPVFDNDGNLVGVISTVDLLQALADTRG